eukprot:s274_g5.t2
MEALKSIKWQDGIPWWQKEEVHEGWPTDEEIRTLGPFARVGESVEGWPTTCEPSPVESSGEAKPSVEGLPSACEPSVEPSVEEAKPPVEAEPQAVAPEPSAQQASVVDEAEPRCADANEVIPLPDAAPEDLPLPREMFYREEQNDEPWWEPPAEDEPDEAHDFRAGIFPKIGGFHGVAQHFSCKNLGYQHSCGFLNGNLH